MVLREILASITISKKNKNVNFTKFNGPLILWVLQYVILNKYIRWFVHTLKIVCIHPREAPATYT